MPFVAEPPTIPCDQNGLARHVGDITSRKQRLSVVTSPRDTVPAPKGFEVGLNLVRRQVGFHTRVFKGRSIQKVDRHRRAIAVADRQSLAVRTEGDAHRCRADSPDGVAGAAEVWAGAVRIVPVKANEPVEACCRETAVARERRAVAIVSILVVAEGFGPILVAVEDAEAVGTAERCGEITAVRRKGQEKRCNCRRIRMNPLYQIARGSRSHK